MKQIIIAAIIFFTINISLAKERDQIKINLAKAELAFLDNNDKDFKIYINKNFKINSYNCITTMLLIDYYISKKMWKKATTTIKKFFFYKLEFNIFDYILKNKSYQNKIKRPNIYLLSMFLKTADFFYKASEDPNLELSKKIRNLTLSFNFYFICYHYKFSLMDTIYGIRNIKSKLNDFHSSIGLFTKIKKTLEKSADKYSNEINEVELIIAESLLQEGFIDDGIMLLKKIELSRKSSLSLKNYAKSYISVLNASFLGASVGTNINYSSNIHQLEGTEKESIAPNTSGSFYWEKNINLLYASKKIMNILPSIYINGSENLNTSKSNATFDYRLLNLRVEAMLDNKQYSIWKMGFIHSMQQSRGNTQSKFSTSEKTYSPIISYLYLLKYGRIGHDAQIIFRRYGSEKLTDYSYNINYLPYNQSKFLAPSYLFEVKRYDEGLYYNKSYTLLLSASNHYHIMRKLHNYSSIELERKQNKEKDISYYNLLLSTKFSYIFNDIDAELGLKRIDYHYDNKAIAGEWVISLGINYNIDLNWQ